MRVDGGHGRATTRAHAPHPLPARPYDTTNRPAKVVYRRGWGPCCQYRLNKEEGGSMMERDGRPQGPTTPHPLPARPYDTTNWLAKAVYRRGRGGCGRGDGGLVANIFQRGRWV